MKVSFKKIFACLALVAATFAPIVANNTASASAYNTNTPDCAIAIKGSTNDSGKSSSRFADFGDGFAHAIVIVAGNSNCTKDVTASSWRAPYGKNSTLPITSQTLFSTKTWHLGPGVHTLTTTVPSCLYQLDLLYGTSPYAPDGWSPLYPNEQKLGWTFGNFNKICTPPVTPPQTCPDGSSAPGNDASKCPVKCPDGTPAPGNDAYKCPVKCPNGSTTTDGKCPVSCEEATPSMPATNPEECQKPCEEQNSEQMKNDDGNDCPAPVIMGKVALPDVLPATGAGSIAAIFAIAAAAGTLGYRYMLRRRQNA